MEERSVEDILFEYLKNVIYSPEKAELELKDLPDKFQDLGEGMLFLGQCVREQKVFGKALIRGDFEHNVPNIENGIAAPLKEVHGVLRHLVWQSRQIAKGDYNQRLDYFGELSESFNSMVQQLKEREDNLKQKNKELENLLDMFKDITSEAPYYVVILEHNRKQIAYLNQSAKELKQRRPETFCLIYEKIQSCYKNTLISIDAPKDYPEMQHYRVITKSNSKDEVQVYMIIDNTEQMSKELQLEKIVYEDALTGLNNRRYGQLVMKELQKANQSFAVAFVDLDHLKYCNDVYGHEKGDHYILEVCHFLQKKCMDATICRVGGDEFIIIKAGYSTQEMELELKEISSLFLESHRKPFQKSFSFGVSECVCQEEGAVSAALEEADVKMYQYKMTHKQKIQYPDDRI